MRVTTLEHGPRERATLVGLDRVSDADLVALLLGTGTPGRPVVELARDVLSEAGGLAGLARGGVPSRVGVGEAKRARIEAAIELGRRVQTALALERRHEVASPEAVAAWARAELGAHLVEELWVLALDAKNQLLAARRVAVGSAASCPVSVRDVLRVVLRAGGLAFVLVHNHPTGDPTPSVEDVSVTRALHRAGEACAVPLVDHVVVGARGFVSMFTEGLLVTSS